MKIRYVDASTGQYVHWFNKNSDWSNTPSDWYGELSVSQNSETKVKSINIGGESTALFNAQCITNISGYLKSADGIEAESTSYNYSDYIKVKEGDVISVTGYGGNSSVGVVVGYDANKVFVATLLAGAGTAITISNELVAIPLGVEYIRVTIANNTSTYYVPVDIHFAIKNLGQDIKPNKYGMLVTKFMEGYYVSANDGVVNSASNFQVTDFIPVTQGDRIFYSGYAGGAAASGIYGYDSAYNAVSSLLTGVNKEYINAEIVVPSNVSFIRVCTATSSHSKYSLVSVSIQSNYKELIFDKETDIDLRDTDLGRFWTTDGSLKVGVYRVYNAPLLSSVKIATEQSIQSIIRDVPFINCRGYFEFFITLNDITTSHAKYIRLQSSDMSETDLILKYVSETVDIWDAVNTLRKTTFDFNTLHGKNVVIMGDSISAVKDKSVVEITIEAEDVGVELKAYVTKYDVDAGLTLGGVTYTSNDIGNEVTFTPTNDDIGKKIGVPRYYYESMKVWWEWIKDYFDCNMIPVCWSGSGLTRNRQYSDDYKPSYAWHESQIRKCGIRTPGSMERIAPDVIIIERGGNDFVHAPYAMLTDGYFDNYNIQYPDTDIRQDGEYGFKEAYFMTIGKLREAYPFAKIVLCTYWLMKQPYSSHFPPNNGIYSEPQYNNAIREIADFCGCDVLELNKCGITFENIYPTYASDSAEHPVHLNEKGHKVMGLCAIKALKNINFDL